MYKVYMSYQNAGQDSLGVNEHMEFFVKKFPYEITANDYFYKLKQLFDISDQPAQGVPQVTAMIVMELDGQVVKQHKK